MTKKESLKLIQKTELRLRLALAALERLKDSGLRASNAPDVLEKTAPSNDILYEFVIVEQMICEIKDLIDGVESWKMQER